jgi:hypothetical protein
MIVSRLLAAMAVCVSVLWPASVDACSCLGPGLPCEAAWSAEAVFVGHVVSIETSGGRRVQLAVVEAFRGFQLSQVTVVTGYGQADCGFPFEMGKSYVVYANRDRNGELTTSSCARTRPVENAAEDLTYLRSLATIVPGAPARLAGRVQLWEYPLPPGSELKPMSGVAVTATRAGEKVSAPTNERGEFELNGLALGTYDLVATPPPGYDNVSRRISIHDPRGCGVTTLFVQYDGRVTGRVVDGRGSGIAGLPIDLLRRSDLDRADDRVRRVQGWTAADGTYELRLVAPGEYVMGANWIRRVGRGPGGPVAYYPGVAERSDAATIAVSVGDRVRLKDFVIPAAVRLVTVNGIVVDETGRPVREARIYLRDNGESPNILGPQFVTGEDGRFVFTVREGLRHDVHVTRYVGDDLRTTEVQTAIVPFTASPATPSSPS